MSTPIENPFAALAQQIIREQAQQMVKDHIRRNGKTIAKNIVLSKLPVEARRTVHIVSEFAKNRKK